MWLSKDELEKKLIELIKDERYEKFIFTMERLLQHPYAYTVEAFIRNYRKPINAGRNQLEDIARPTVGEDGRSYVTVKGMHQF